MDWFDKNFTEAIVTKLKFRLERDLTAVELKAFTMRRSGIVYEMIMDYISDNERSKEEIDRYVKAIVDENS